MTRYAVQQADAPELEKPRNPRFRLDGVVGDRINATVTGWLLPAPDANPAIIDMFRDRDRKPKRELVPWAGEFIGKFLIGAQQLLALTGDPELYALIDRLVDELLPLQSDDGYLGPFPREERLVMHWDVWGHYHVMQALLMYHERTGCDDSLDACRRMADLLHDFFVQGKRRMVTDSDADGEKNYAVIHSVIWLYRLTGEERHLELARWIESEWEEPPAGDYVREALSGKPVWEFPVKRWESLHDHQGIAELALLTGDVKYETAYKHIWWNMVEGDRHNDGGFTSSEACCGNPYDLGAIETCCTLAWIAHSIDMLRLTRDSRVADEIELSTLNGMIGAQHPSGRWWTYNTPMDGTRKASQHDIVFQARAGSPEFNCCSANAARGIGMISEWAVMTTESGIALNYYGPGEIGVELRDGTPVSIVQETYYPLDGAVIIRVNPETPSTFPLDLRVPDWSAETTVTLNGKAVSAIPGEYLRLDREWAGDEIRVEFDMSPHVWVGDRDCAGKVSIYRGPILLAFDPRFNDVDPENVPEIDLRTLNLTRTDWTGSLEPWLLVKTEWESGSIVLCDFASAGMTGTTYRSWLPARGMEPVGFNRASAIWNRRP